MIRPEYKWNQVYKIIMLIKEDYQVTFGDGETNFKTWLKKLDNTVWNKFAEQLQFTQDNNLLLVRYGLHDLEVGLWENPNSIYRETRSLVIDLAEDSIVLCPFRKFFNLNEVEENKLENIIEEMTSDETNGRVYFMNKLDGSMQSARWYNGRVVMSGSRSLNPKQSWRLEEGLKMLDEQYITMLIDNPQYTFIFEFIHLNDQHVVHYTKEQEGLYLIGARNVYTGKELTIEDLTILAKLYDIKVVEREAITLEEVLEKAKEVKCSEKEGWVLDINGHKVKIKADDYVQLHRCLDYVSSINVIIRNVARGTIDDLIAKIPDQYKHRVTKIAQLFLDEKNRREKAVIEYYEQAPKEDKKEFMIWVDSNVDTALKGYVKMHYLNKPYNVFIGKNLFNEEKTQYYKANELGVNVDYSAIFGVAEDINLND